MYICRRQTRRTAYDDDNDYDTQRLLHYFRTLSDIMAASSPHHDGDGGRNSYVPRWDGDSRGWLRYKDEVEMWLMGENLNVQHVIAARLIAAMSGSARRACIKFTRDVLFPTAQAVEDDPNINSRERCNERGVRNVMERLRTTLGVTEPERRGEAMTEFFGSNKYHRRAGERVSEWLLRFDVGLQRLKDDGIDMVRHLEDVADWMMVMQAGLNSERRERVMSALPLDRPYHISLI